MQKTSSLVIHKWSLRLDHTHTHCDRFNEHFTCDKKKWGCFSTEFSVYHLDSHIWILSIEISIEHISVCRVNIKWLMASTLFRNVKRKKQPTIERSMVWIDLVHVEYLPAFFTLSQLRITYTYFADEIIKEEEKNLYTNDLLKMEQCEEIHGLLCCRAIFFFSPLYSISKQYTKNAMKLAQTVRCQLKNDFNSIHTHTLELNYSKPYESISKVNIFRCVFFGCLNQ